MKPAPAPGALREPAPASLSPESGHSYHASSSSRVTGQPAARMASIRLWNSRCQCQRNASTQTTRTRSRAGTACQILHVRPRCVVTRAVTVSPHRSATIWAHCCSDIHGTAKCFSLSRHAAPFQHLTIPGTEAGSDPLPEDGTVGLSLACASGPGRCPPISNAERL